MPSISGITGSEIMPIALMKYLQVKVSPARGLDLPAATVAQKFRLDDLRVELEMRPHVALVGDEVHVA